MAKKTKKVAAKVSVPPDPLQLFQLQAEKRWTKSIIRASDMPSREYPRISTGNFALDIATFGGWPRGRISRAWGTPRSTKSGSCLNTITAWQKHCAYCFARGPCKCSHRRPAGTLIADLENKLADSLMIDWMTDHGIDMSAVLFQRPDSGNEVIDLVDMAIRQGIGLVIVDSIAHMVSRAEIEKPTEDGELPGRSAKLVNKAMRKWVIALSQRGFEDVNKVPTIIIINQIRGTLSQYIPETLPGGKGQNFATSLDIRFSSSKSKWRFRSVKSDGTFTDLKKSDMEGAKKLDATPDYQEVDYRVTTSSCCPPGRSGTYRYWLKNTHGRRKGDPDNAASVWMYAKRYGLLTTGKEGRCLKIPEGWAQNDEERETEFCNGRINDDVMQNFRNDDKAQQKLWDVFIRELCRS